MKFLSITLITALFVIGAVLVGVPAYKALATTTTNCLHDYSYEPVDVSHPWHPCGHIFTVNHYGFGEETSPCHCEHQPIECVVVALVDYTDETIEYEIPMGLNDISASCNDGGVPDTKWCGAAHVPRGEPYDDHGTTKYHWKYFFKCDGGSRLPTTPGVYYEFDTDPGCLNAEFASKMCDQENLCD